MISARPTRVVAERCRNGMKEIQIRKPKKDSPVFKYKRPDRIRIGDQPTVMDPYEKRTIYIGAGKVDDGIFAKRNIRDGELVMYYSGVIFDPHKHAIFSSNQTRFER